MVVIIDYGVGNLRSVQKSFERAGINTIISNDIKKISLANKLVLPGVGHFKHAIVSLKNSGLLDTLNKRVLDDKIPILGICLGMQLMTEFSEEGNLKGLGWIKAKTKKFKIDLKVPHIGWTTSKFVKSNKFTLGVDTSDEFYFVHSYYVKPFDNKYILSRTKYCNFEYCSSIKKDNVFATQFHPEKSGKKGLEIYKNWSKLL